MGDVNQEEFLKKNRHLGRGPILELGSKNYGNTVDYRPLFDNAKYIGIDMEAGKGVDKVLDLSMDHEKILDILGVKTVNSIICFSVLEHCRELAKVRDNIVKLLNIDGIFFVSVPFSWEFHGFPDDYWRFSPNGIKALFPELEFDDDLTTISTSNPGEMTAIEDSEYFKIDLAPKEGIRKGRYGILDGILIKSLKTLGLLRPLLNNIYVMPPVSVNMIGRKKG